MVVDEECDYMYVEYVKDLWMKVNVGICCWFVLLFDNDCNQIELFIVLLLLLFGLLVFYYGDEIGMGDVIWLGDCDGVCILMQWILDCNVGFFIVNLGWLYLLFSQDLVYGYQVVNVEV